MKDNYLKVNVGDQALHFRMVIAAFRLDSNVEGLRLVDIGEGHQLPICREQPPYSSFPHLNRPTFDRFLLH